MLNIPIVIAAWNREDTLERLLASLEKAHYAEPVKLIISIDGGGPDAVRKCAEEFQWPHGQKQVIAHTENLGLRRHILSCGELSRQYDGIILLEDDLFVSPWFYRYTMAALEFYKGCEEISGISLYACQYNESALLPFKPLDDGSDTFFMQLPCSWGQVWLKEHWESFSVWYDLNAGTNPSEDLTLPPNIVYWPDSSWKKYFLKYMVAAGKFFVYPRHSYTTNFGDKGVHHQGTNVFQVPLYCGNLENYRFQTFAESLIKYDVFCELLPDSLNKLCGSALPLNLSVDLYGSKRIESLTGEYVITTKKCLDFQESYARRMIPPEMNIINRIAGSELFLTKIEMIEEFGEINKFVYDKAGSESEQKYYFGTDYMHYTRLRDYENMLVQAEISYNNSLVQAEINYNNRLDQAEKEFNSRLEQAENVIRSVRDANRHLQQTFEDYKTQMLSSISWRITKPLRWLGDKMRRSVKSKE